MLGRRRFLGAAGGLGLSAAAAQLLRPLTAHAGGTPIPKRLVVFFTPNGVIEDLWRPTGGELDFRLPPMLAPLERHRDQLLVFGPSAATSNARQEVGVSIHVKGDGEGASSGHGLTKLLTGSMPRVVADAEEASSVSIDQMIARRIQGEAPFASLQLGVRIGAGSNGAGSRCISWADAGVPLPAENDPNAAFDRVFAAVGAPDPATARRRSRRRSVLDFASGEIASLRPRLGSTDRALLDAHQSAIRDAERVLGATTMCTAPTGIGPIERNDWDTYTNLPQIARMQLDIAATALSCDLVRVVGLQFSGAGANTRHPFLEGRANDWHHGLSHDPADPAARAALSAIGAWHAEQLASLLDRLAATPERDGSTVLDHTVVLWVNELSNGFYHTHQNMPFLLAGSAGGALRTGRYVQYASKPHNDLLVSVAHAMGLDDVTTFGAPAFCTGPLPGLT